MNKMKTKEAEKDWGDVLQKQIDRAGGLMPFFIQKCTCQKVYHETLKKYASKFENPSLLEVGCGTAFDSIYLSYFFKKINAIDNDERVLHIARKNNKYFYGKATIIKGDLFKINKKYNIIFNNGTYEHFSIDKIREAIKLHLENSNFVIFVVPLNMEHDFEPFGNELLMPEREWRNVIKEANGEVIEVFGLDFKYNFLAPATYVSKLSKIFSRLGNYRIFVITKKQ